MKVAEDSPNTSSVISKMIEEFFPPEYIAVVNGDKEVATELLEQKMDYIFFTGGVTVGKIVMEKAAKNLIPVTLELGGKSPCIVELQYIAQNLSKKYSESHKEERIYSHKLYLANI